MPYNQNGCHVHHRRALGDLGEKSNKWRGNGPRVYANHSDQFILKLSCGIPNHWVCRNGVLECSGSVGALSQGRQKNSISVGEDERCAPEWFSLTSMGPPHPVTHE